MNMSFFYSLNLSLFLLFISFNKILNQTCDNTVDLTGLTEDEQKQKCHSLSTFNNNGDLQKCCYNPGSSGNPGSCAQGDTTNTSQKCPGETFVPNNCGMAGIFPPASADVCKEISLVQGYCCYVKLKKSDNSESTSCIRTKKLNKEKNEATDQIKKYVGDGYTIESVECNGTNIKYYWLLVIAAVMLL